MLFKIDLKLFRIDLRINSLNRPRYFLSNLLIYLNYLSNCQLINHRAGWMLYLTTKWTLISLNWRLIILLNFLLFDFFLFKILLKYYFFLKFWPILRITCIILKHFYFHIFILNILVLLFRWFYYNFFRNLTFY